MSGVEVKTPMTEPISAEPAPVPESPVRPLTKARRLRQIAEVLSRYGLGFLINRYGLMRLIPGRKLELDASDEEQVTNPESLRKALEELGTTAIKFGQVLSTR